MTMESTEATLPMMSTGVSLAQLARVADDPPPKVESVGGLPKVR